MELLGHLSVVEASNDVAVGFAGRLLALMGAQVHALPRPTRADRPPFDAQGRSGLERYLAAGKIEADGFGNDGFGDTVDSSNIILIGRDDPRPQHPGDGPGRAPIPADGQVVVRCSPYGPDGPKANWQASELTIFHAGGEAYLVPSGLARERFPDRPPTTVGRYVASYQAGTTIALAAVAALRRSRERGVAEFVEVSVQQAQMSMNYLSVSRYVDGFEENRDNRAHRYGGVFECRDGCVVLITLEQHQWEALAAMLGNPEWAAEERFQEPLSRAQHGVEINEHLRAWLGARTVAEVVAATKQHEVPCGAVVEPNDLMKSPGLAARHFFGAPGDPDYPFPGAAWRIMDAADA